MARVEIAVIGGGAKAAALAAKARVLSLAGIADVHITIFEPVEIGCHWSGKAGYTDGKQRLCTPAERDMGFPYASMYGSQVDGELHTRFSWASYLLTQARQYSKWVDGGRQAPMHEDFARYLQWVVRGSGATVVKARVEALKVAGSKWHVLRRVASGALIPGSDIEFDGVVISGPGSARRVGLSGTSERVLDGESFWKRLGSIPRMVRKTDTSAQIAIIGAGGTAAATLAWLTRNGYKDHEIVIVASQAALFTRGDSVFENRLFSDEAAWQSLSPKSRREFFDRLNRGVVWSTVMDQVSGASRLVFHDGRVERIRAPSSEDLQVQVRSGDGSRISLRPSLVIDASGFDAWWFLRLLPGLPARTRRDTDFRESLQEAMGPGLEFGGPTWEFPRLHAPLLSSNIGPGFGSLMSLGGMSDRVLRLYLG